MNSNSTLEKIVCLGLWKLFNEESDGEYSSVALSGATYTFNSNNLYLVQGHNGSGKTSFLSILSGHSSPSEGRVEYHFTDGKIDNKIPSSWQLASLVSRNSMYENLSTRENLELLWRNNPFSSEPFHFKKPEFNEEITRLNEAFLLNEMIDRPLRELSQGFRQRAHLMRLFLRGSPLAKPWYILDEPSIYLDNAGLNALCLLIKSAIMEGATIILASHDSELINALTGTSLFMSKGKLSGLSNE
ncbi:MAG TPA: ATP-binding cassette domain-containing protein [Oligoflexia bacterium]|nr:ATP-binding cassette domain-containing protein [Oligoflexia bacterium]HMP48826.1 ATP-binding cassette domain-containing protein [Oligoflexia bacterium]